MCGICGFAKIELDVKKYGEQYLLDMCNTMIHRGPDGGNVWLDKENKCGLGHRRLSIIDLSNAATQPMSNADGSIVIAFNGEIYNHAEIRKELESTGKYIWKTSHSDTEVIIHSYEEWGIDCLKKFRGMFGIALWDGRNKKFYLIRDRIGIKPVYYTIENGVLTFASEIKAILKVSDKRYGINKKAFYDYLSFLCTPNDDTLFDGIKKIRPGTWLCIENGKITINKYYDILDNVDKNIAKASEAEIIEMIRSELRTAVKLRKESDVPVGVFLSGGIDSSTNTALFSEGENTKVKTFCVGYPAETESYKSEFGYAKIMADFAKSEHHEHVITAEEALEFLPKMVYQQDEPISDPVCIPVYFVSKLARDNGITVAQVGEGSDELFWGYQAWKTFSKINILNKIPGTMWAKKLIYNYFINKPISKGLEYECIRRAIDNEPLFWSGAESFYETEKQRMISAELKSYLGNYSSFDAIKPTYDNYMEKSLDKSFVNWMAYADLNHRLPELLLMRVDKMSMLVSLECRVPFLDHKFVELGLSIPEKIKIKNWERKHILKKAVEGIIPNELIYRKKQGFGAPVMDWFKGSMGVKMKESVMEMVDNTDLFNKDYMHRHLSEDSDTCDWFLFNLSMWWKQFIA